MADHVYRRFQKTDLLTTKVHAQPSIVVDSGSAGWTNGTLSLYAGVRARADVGPTATGSLQVYPIDLVDTHSIDKVIGIPGSYPQTGSINLVYVTDTEQPTEGAATDTRWYEEHWGAINILSDWYNGHRYSHFPALDQLPPTMSLVHIPEMFYGRQIATGTVYIENHAWDTASGSNFGSGTRYYVDDGYGRLFDVPAALTGNWLTAWNSGTAVQVGNVFYVEGLIVFTSPTASWHSEFLSQSYNNVTGSGANFHLELSGSTLIRSMTFMCRLGSGEANMSNNPSWQTTIGQTYITSIGMYNEERELIAVAKIAQPIRKRPEDTLDIRLRMDMI